MSRRQWANCTLWCGNSEVTIERSNYLIDLILSRTIKIRNLSFCSLIPVKFNKLQLLTIWILSIGAFNRRNAHASGSEGTRFSSGPDADSEYNRSDTEKEWWYGTHIWGTDSNCDNYFIIVKSNSVKSYWWMIIEYSSNTRGPGSYRGPPHEPRVIGPFFIFW